MENKAVLEKTELLQSFLAVLQICPNKTELKSRLSLLTKKCSATLENAQLVALLAPTSAATLVISRSKIEKTKRENYSALLQFMTSFLPLKIFPTKLFCSQLRATIYTSQNFYVMRLSSMLAVEYDSKTHLKNTSHFIPNPPWGFTPVPSEHNTWDKSK